MTDRKNRMNVSLKIIFVSLILSFFIHNSVQAGDLERGKQLYFTCIACHGDKAQGKSVLKAPQLAGQESWYLESQLKKFKEGIRGSHPKDTRGRQMAPMAKTLVSEMDVKNVATYISSLIPHSPQKTIQGGSSEKGKIAYATCMACHGDKAQGNSSLKAPGLKNLPDWYLMTQLKNFKQGIRGANPKDIEGMQMKPMANMLVDEQAIKNVIAYIETLTK
jgi:cytochrome c oxidase subunit 2